MLLFYLVERMSVMKKYLVRVVSEYEYVIEVEDESELSAEEIAWEQDWTTLIRNGEIVEVSKTKNNEKEEEQ